MAKKVLVVGGSGFLGSHVADELTKKGFEVWIIPHTYNLTNLSNLKINSLVNIEIDILSKYVKKYIS